MTRSEEQTNVVAYHRTADAFRAGDLETLQTLLAPDVVWHVPGRHATPGDVRGLDKLVAWLGRLCELGFTLRERDVFGNDEHARALSHMGAQRPGSTSRPG